MRAKNISILVILLPLASQTFAQTPKATGDEVVLDDSGALAFVQLCRSKRPIGTEDIDKLLRLDPYQRMIRWTKENWYDLDQAGWREIFVAALAPNKASSEIKIEAFKQRVEGIRQAWGNCEQIERYLYHAREHWPPNGVFLRLRKYLPGNLPAAHARLSYVVGLGQGGVYDFEILLDVSTAMTQETPGWDPDEVLPIWIAHELHHVYRNLLQPEDYVPNKQYKGIAQVLFWLESEGIADMVIYDRRSEDAILLKMGEGWRPIYKQADAYLTRLDGAIMDVLRGPVTATDAYSHVTQVLVQNNAYHPVGFAMAQRIDDQLGREALIRCVGKPYDFLETYQRAAKKIGDRERAYVFKDDLVSRLASIGWRVSP